LSYLHQSYYSRCLARLSEREREGGREREGERVRERERERESEGFCIKVL
jgi:hypothetical protein